MLGGEGDKFSIICVVYPNWLVGFLSHGTFLYFVLLLNFIILTCIYI